ncbi:glucose-6-phosphate dehydrogenase assembly protein OpcA [bacterium]|nr:glucose-6-phosphate dehydrogenase assembly protein OpcA [bacterium]
MERGGDGKAEIRLVKYRWALFTTEPKDLRQFYESHYRKMAQEQEVSRPLNSNTVILDYRSVRNGQAVEEWAELFAECLPGRIAYFLSHSSENEALLLTQAKLPVSSKLLCGSLIVSGSDGRGKYSDIVVGLMDQFVPRALLSLLRGQYQVGFPPTVVVLGTPSNPEILRALALDAKALFFSSRDSQLPHSVVDILEERGVDVVDLEWLRTSGWRAQLRNFSTQYDLSAMLSDIDRIELLVRGEVGGRPVLSSCTTLFVGWLLSQLRSRVSSFHRGTVECVTSVGRKWNLSFSLDDKAPAAIRMGDMLAVELLVSEENLSSRSFFSPRRVRITLPEAGLFETEVFTEDGSSCVTGTHRELGAKEDLRRFFVRGDSTASYPEAFILGKEFSDLLSGAS